MLLQRIDAALAALTQAAFRSVERDVLAALSPSEDITRDDVDSIANLALLDRTVNSALSNGFFEVKRTRTVGPIFDRA